MAETADKDRGHVWKLDSRGRVDEFGLDIGYHNGPICSVCGYSYCQHCDAGPEEDCPGAEAVAKAEADRLALRQIEAAAPDLLSACIQSRAVFEFMLGDEKKLPAAAQDQSKINLMASKINDLSLAIGKAQGTHS